MDERKKEIVEARNRAEAAIYAAQKLIEEKDVKDSSSSMLALRETLEKLKASLTLDSRLPNRVKELTSELLELIGNMNTKRNKICQARILISSAEKNLDCELSMEKRKNIEVAFRELEEASCRDVEKKMNALKETIMFY